MHYNCEAKDFSVAASDIFSMILLWIVNSFQYVWAMKISSGWIDQWDILIITTNLSTLPWLLLIRPITASNNNFYVQKYWFPLTDYLITQQAVPTQTAPGLSLNPVILDMPKAAQRYTQDSKEFENTQHQYGNRRILHV